MSPYFFLLPILAAGISHGANFAQLTHGITEYLHSNGVHKPAYFLQAAADFQYPNLLQHHEEAEAIYDNGQVCYLCELVANLVIRAHLSGIDRDTLFNTTTELCTLLGIEKERVCRGAINNNIDVLLYIIDNRPSITGERVCGLVLQNVGCQSSGDFDWSVNIRPGSPPDRPERGNGPPLRILHISDVHYDPLYKVGGNADCGEPMCCQEDQPGPASQATSCGYWTDYRKADSPWHLVEETVRQIKTHDFDIVYFTGDVINHRVWETSVANNSKDIKKFYEYISEEFSQPKYFIMGNHETHPINLWPGPSVRGFSIKWLLDLVADLYTDDEEARATLEIGGYYTTTLKAHPKFRIVGLNTNVGYIANFWLLLNDTDPFGQLQWLADTLDKAEANDERVHILFHVPSNAAHMLDPWSREYRRIIERYASTVTGQFNGHTHRDMFNVFYDSKNASRAVGAAFNGASITPYSDANPSYKIFTVDPETFHLIDYDEWTFNLTLANAVGGVAKPEWYKLYSFCEAYGVRSLEAREVNRVLHRMAANHSLLDDYFRYKVRNGDRGLEGGCDESCQKNNLCDIARSEIGDDTQCNYFSNLYDDGGN